MVQILDGTQAMDIVIAPIGRSEFDADHALLDVPAEAAFLARVDKVVGRL